MSKIGKTNVSQIVKILNILIVLGSLFAIYISYHSVIKEPYWILPIVYAMLFTVCTSNKSELGKLPGNTTLNVIVFLRFFILPIVVLATGEYGGIVNNYKFLTEGIYLMTYELIAVFAANEYFINKLTFPKKSDEHISFKFKKKNLTLLISFMVLIMLMLTNRSLVGGIGLITQGYVEIDGSVKGRSALVSLLWQALTTWIYVYLIMCQKMRYEKKKDKKYILYSILFTFLFALITFISQSQISRWYTGISTIASVYFLNKLFPQHKKTISTIVLTPALLFIMVVTIYKNVSTEARLNYESAESILTSSGFLNAYLSGPSSVNNAIGLYKQGDVGIGNLPNDMLNNMPIINHFLTEGQTTVYKYNKFIGRVGSDNNGDQIIPLIGQGLAYFGPVLCVLISILMCFFIRVCDLRFALTDSTYMFIFSFLACWFGVEMCLNMTINLSWIYIRIFPMWLMFYIAEKMKL